jgi:hypothetical protein
MVRLGNARLVGGQLAARVAEETARSCRRVGSEAQFDRVG